MKYPKRTEHQGYEGAACIFDVKQNFCVTIAFDGRKYKITTAWREENFLKMMKLPDYPFIRTSRDRQLVEKLVQTACTHEWDYYNYHCVCPKCNLWLQGDYRVAVLELKGPEALDLQDQYILEKYGKTGLALRRARAGIKDGM